MRPSQLLAISRPISERIARDDIIRTIKAAADLPCSEEEIRAFLYRVRERFVVETFHEQVARSGYKGAPKLPWKIDHKINREGIREDFENQRGRLVQVNAGHAASRPPNKANVSRQSAIRVVFREAERFYQEVTRETFDPKFRKPFTGDDEQDYYPRNRAAHFFAGVLAIIAPTWDDIEETRSLYEKADDIIEMIREDGKNRGRSRKKLPHGSE